MPFIEKFQIDDTVITDEGRQAVVIGMDAEIRVRQNKVSINEKYLLDYQDGSRGWKRVELLTEYIVPDHEPIKEPETIDQLLMDCLLLSTSVPLEVRIATIKEMHLGIEGEDLQYGL